MHTNCTMTLLILLKGPNSLLYTEVNDADELKREEITRDFSSEVDKTDTRLKHNRCKQKIFLF